MTIVFGLDVPTSAAPEADPLAEARAAERLGFDLVSASDHPCGTHPSHETWTMLAWIAAGTSRIRVATRVLGLPFRAPAMVAKAAATLDALSGGRVIRGLWTEPGFTFTGRHFHVEGAELEPKPGGRIPIWLGTFGPRALEVTGRVADGWVPSLGYRPTEELPAMRRRVLDAALAAGRNPATITCALNLEVRIGDGPTGPATVAGSPDAVAEALLGFTRLGFTAFNLKPVGSGRAEQVERLAAEVLPTVRDGARAGTTG